MFFLCEYPRNLYVMKDHYIKHQLYLILFCMVLVLPFMSCSYMKGLVYGRPDIEDMHHFPLKIFKPDSIEQNQILYASGVDSALNVCIDRNTLKETKTVAFLVLHGDSLIYEYYASDKFENQQIDLFSISKSVVSSLVGIALEEGYIRSLNDPVSDYIRNIDPSVGSSRIIELMDMRSGLQESFFKTIDLYYGGNLNRKVAGMKIKPENKGSFFYSNATVLILAEIISVATGQSFTNYFQDKLWRYIPAGQSASWSLDPKDRKTARAFCGLNMSARDIARFGQLYLHDGKIGEVQVIPSEWISYSRMDRHPEDKQNMKYSYNLLWRHISSDELFAKGLLGQYLYINWDKNLVVVRLGEKSGDEDWIDKFKIISDQF